MLPALLKAGKLATTVADAMDYKLSPNTRKMLDPVGTMATAATGAAESAMGLPKGSIAFAADPKAFGKDIMKDMGKDYVKKKIRGDDEEVPVEDRSPQMRQSSGGGGSYSYDYGDSDYNYDAPGMSFGEGEYKRGGQVKRKAKVSSASRRGDGIAQRGKTKGRYL